VCGIVHDPIDLEYQFTPYMPGNRPWRTTDRGGQWLSDHTPPCSILFLPGDKPRFLIGSTLAEGAHALVWTDAEGRKIQGATNIGTTYTGPSKLTRPIGKSTLPFVAYGVGVNSEGTDLGIVGITADQKTVQLYYDDSFKLLRKRRTRSIIRRSLPDSRWRSTAILPPSFPRSLVDICHHCRRHVADPAGTFQRSPSRLPDGNQSHVRAHLQHRDRPHPGPRDVHAHDQKRPTTRSRTDALRELLNETVQKKTH